MSNHKKTLIKTIGNTVWEYQTNKIQYYINGIDLTVIIILVIHLKEVVHYFHLFPNHSLPKHISPKTTKWKTNVAVVFAVSFLSHMKCIELTAHYLSRKASAILNMKMEETLTNYSKFVRSIWINWRRSLKPKASRRITIADLIVILGIILKKKRPIFIREQAINMSNWALIPSDF